MLEHLGTACFYTLATLAVVCSGGMILTRHPLHGALWLIGIMASLAGLYLLLDSPFVGILQLLVYAGAIMMLVVFVIMVLNRAKDNSTRAPDGLSLLGALVPLALGGILVPQILASQLVAMPKESLRGEVPAIAHIMFNTDGAHGYWLLFQLIGVLLLIAVLAAVLLAKRTLDVVDQAKTSEGEHHDQH